MSLADKAYELVKNKLVLAHYLPGDVLSENELSSELMMSRTPVRAALARLEREGFVSIVKNRGVFVNKISTKEVYEHNDVINSFIIFTTDLVNKGNVKLDLAVLAELLGEIEQAIKLGDYPNYMNNYLSFLREVIKTSKNRVMVQIFDETSEKIKWTGVVNHKQNPESTFYTSYELAKKLYEKFAQSDYEQIRELLYCHLEAAKKRYMVLSQD